MASPSPLSNANSAFSLALLNKLGDKDKTANVFYSPFSISSALAMVMLGARGDTAAQMSQVLCFSEAEKGPHEGDQHQQCLKTKDCQDDVHAAFAQLLREINTHNKSYSLSVANRLYGEKSYKFVEDFLAQTKKYYSAELEPVDFRTKYEEARLNINCWVEKNTQGKIKDLLEKGMVDCLTRLVLVNAIYFKVNWSQKFQEEATMDADFKLNKNNTKPVKMMHQKNTFPLTQIPEVNCQVLELPYRGKDLSMLIFLPNSIEDCSTGLEKLEKELTFDKFVQWTHPDRMKEVQVQVGLPRFSMEEQYDMKTVLTSMGMVDAFIPGMSDFSGMSPANDLVLSKVVHKAFVEVNEEGTEAAAATGAVMKIRCYVPPATFIADHPFLFFIRHNRTMSILFVGRYCSP